MVQPNPCSTWNTSSFRSTENNRSRRILRRIGNAWHPYKIKLAMSNVTFTCTGSGALVLKRCRRPNLSNAVTKVGVIHSVRTKEGGANYKGGLTKVDAKYIGDDTPSQGHSAPPLCDFADAKTCIERWCYSIVRISSFALRSLHASHRLNMTTNQLLITSDPDNYNLQLSNLITKTAIHFSSKFSEHDHKHPEVKYSGLLNIKHPLLLSPIFFCI